MSPWAKRASNTIPRVKSPETTYEINDYSKGLNSFVSNDKFPLSDGKSNMWRLAKNARITTLGEYSTRRGFDFHSEAAGSTEDQTITSTTGADDESFSSTVRLAQTFTAGTTGRLHKVDVNIKNPDGATGTVIVEIWSDDGSPDTMLARSSIKASDITSSYQYLTARFPDAPSVTSATAYWIVVYVQNTGTNSYNWSSTTSATTAKSSTDSGDTWSATSYALNFKQYYATDGGVKALFRAYKSDGTKVTLFVQGTTLYSVNNVTGALTAVKTGLSASATVYRFTIVNDVVYYVNGFDGYRKWDFTTESQVSATNYTLITEHKGLMFLATKDDPNKLVFSNFADYETFTSTDFLYIPSPKTGDPMSALVSLNGYLIVATINNKFILSGDDNATFRLDEAPDQKGTYSQETVAVDKNLIYYLANDGMYRSNGSEAQLISENVYEELLTLPNRETAVTVVIKGRLYLWYKTEGSSFNDACYVWNLNYASDADTVESLDTNAYVNRAFNAFSDNNELLVGSSVIGQVYWQGMESNDYTNLGGDIDFELDTHYMTFASPSVLKEIRFWQPRFAASDGNYDISAEFATDLRDNWMPQSLIDTQGAGYLWGDSGTVWGSFTWGSTAEQQAHLYVPGEFRRIALRYKHYATRQPHTFLGHSLVVQHRRMR